MLLPLVVAAALLAPAQGQQRRARARVVSSFSATAQVLAFSEDGTRALVEERRGGPGGASQLGFAVVDAGGVQTRVVIHDIVRTPGFLTDLVNRETCRARVESLEEALKGFRSIRVQKAGCSTTNLSRDIVEQLRTPPSPVSDVKELEAISRDLGLVSGVWVSEDGPLMVVVVPRPNAVDGADYELKMFLREDPRFRDRWPAPRR